MAQTIKTMKLYSAVDRIHNDLAGLGYHREDALDVRVLAALDQLHYHGTDAVDAAIRELGLTAGAQVLDIGAGFGGPARWLAQTIGAHVTAIELQEDMNAIASDLTRRCGLSEMVSHLQGDVLKVPLEAGAFDAAVSWLALYHIPNRTALFPKVHAAIKPGGAIWIEDLYQRGPFTDAEQAHLNGMMAASTMQTQEAYIDELAAAGFTEIVFTDHTEDWAAFTGNRLAAFTEGSDAYIARQGQATYDALAEFYTVIHGLLADGHVGGTQISARRD